MAPNCSTEKFIKNTFDTYFHAANRKDDKGMENIESNEEEVFRLWSSKNMLPLVSAAIQLTSLILSPIIAILWVITMVVYFCVTTRNPIIDNISTSNSIKIHLQPGSLEGVLSALVGIFVFSYIFTYYIFRPKSELTGKDGLNPLGVSIEPGLYYCAEKMSRSSKILNRCPILSSPKTIVSSTPKSYQRHHRLGPNFLMATPWLLSGDSRTLLPFLAFKPRDVAYVRRWVRVPLSDGPRDNLKVKCPEGGEYEAVALDFSPSSSSSTSTSSGSKQALLILAGLTGGSSEGYVLDLVNSANMNGFDCYVMLGRGLNNTPNLSGALFHGARTSDLEETAKLLKNHVLEKDTKLFLVGISMGGIKVSNSISRGNLDSSIISGAICVSGCFDTSKNSLFSHSRKLWQPLLCHGLKETFVSKPGCMTTIKKRMEQWGSVSKSEIWKKENRQDVKNLENKKVPAGMVQEMVERCEDVFLFDSIMVTSIHGFRDVEHYYSDMCGGKEERLMAKFVHASSVGGERGSEREGSQSQQSKGGQPRASLPVPLLAIHAADDPIIHCDTNPIQAAKLIDNFICLITKTGGHVGWPVGWFPTRHRWQFQNTLILEFCEGVTQSEKHF